MDPELRVGVVGVSVPLSWKLAPDCTVTPVEHVKAIPLISNVPATTVHKSSWKTITMRHRQGFWILGNLCMCVNAEVESLRYHTQTTMYRKTTQPLLMWGCVVPLVGGWASCQGPGGSIPPYLTLFLLFSALCIVTYLQTTFSSFWHVIRNFVS